MNQKVYVGSSTNMLARLRGYKKVLKASRCHNIHLQRAWNKYGASNFSFCILEWCLSEMCVPREQYWIDYYDAANPEKGYNVSPTAGSNLGLKYGPLSEAHKREISNRMKGNTHWVGRAHTEETKAILSRIMTGRKPSVETLTKMSAANLGKKLSEETRKKMSESRKGIVFTPERRASISKSLTGKKMPDEVKAKISAAHKGKKLSEETKRRMSEARRGVPWSSKRRAAQA